MNRLGIESLNAGASDLRLTGDQTQRGTYTQRRRTQMAGGGITQIGKPGGLVEPGISKYAWYDFIVDPVKDFVTEKALPTLTKIGQTIIPGGDPGYIPGGLYKTIGDAFISPTGASEPVDEEALQKQIDLMTGGNPYESS